MAGCWISYNITFHFEITGFQIFYLSWVPSLVRDFGKSQRHEIFVETSNNVCYMTYNLSLSIALKLFFLWSPQNFISTRPCLQANPHDAISCTQLISNSLIRKPSLCFWHNGTREYRMIQIESRVRGS